ncbi:methyl-accepting chemotaxis protein [Ectothiorhodospira magna]|uniref:Methyl-accepting chemotaxis protein n=1 Tax=Ectothiorhodospira magna TaxID=867345 RepID=A0A1H9CXM8_9GAMM|nr:methyl-accepting chemotaxis protein [Ectothiorhodospira magna]SEQ05891.1 methyl-accepting chemotaxis protein [Ectothiorhodospira magna]
MTRRLVLAVLLTGGICLLLGLFYVQWLRTALEQEVIEYNGNYLATLLEERLKSKEEFGIGVSVMLAQDPDLSDAYLFGNRDQSHQILTDILDTFRTTTNYRGLRVQIHTEEGMSWQRSWAPDQFGDDLRFRSSIQRMLSEQRPFATLNETGRAGYAIRALAPIMEEGVYRGSLELLQGVGSISRDFEADGAAYILLLSPNALEDSPGIAGNRRVGEYFVANNAWFNAYTMAFAETLDLARLRADGHDLGQSWFGVRVPVINDRGETIGMHVIGMPAEVLREQITDATRSAWMFLGLIALLVILMGPIIALLVQRSIVRPIRNSVHCIRRMEQDMDLRLPVQGNDELAVLSRSFNHYADNLQDILGRISKTSTTLSGAADALVSHSRQGLDLVRQQQQETQLVASASVEMAASASEMSQHAQSTQDAAEEALSSAENGIRLVADTANAIEALAANMRGMLDVIQRLDQGSQSIGKVLETIAEIADQTNLLALNAAIEAARAGEHGRGFAVVADEVRRLASKTQNSTSEIYAIIKELQSSVSDVTDAIDRGQTEAETCVSRAHEASDSLGAIKQTVAGVNEQGTQIALSAREQNHVADEVSRNIVRINTLADDNGQAAEQVLEIAQRLEASADDLKQLLAAQLARPAGAVAR